MDVAITILVAAVGMLLTICITVIMPRVLGQIVPVAQVDNARKDMQILIAQAQAEASTWHKAFDGMKEAYDGLLSIQRETQQSAAIINTVMTQLKQLPPATPATLSGGG